MKFNCFFVSNGCQISVHFTGSSLSAMEINFTTGAPIIFMPTSSGMNSVLFSNETTANSINGSYSDSSEIDGKQYIDPKILRGYVLEDYVVISLYIPVIFAALMANIIIILIVFKDHYMRRYVA